MGTDKTPDQRFQETQDGYKPVHANLDDLNGYGQYMCSTATNLSVNANFAISAVKSGPIKAFKGGQTGTVPEIVDLANKIQSNAIAFTGFFGELTQGLTNIGNAAQVISDTYGGTDGASKADLEAVSFAFADPGAHRPAGLSKDIGELQSQYQYEQQQKAGTDAEALQADPSNYGATAVNVTGNPYATTYTYADGSMIIVSDYGGSVVTTVYGVPKGNALQGKVLSTTTETYTTQANGTTVDTEAVDQDGDGKTDSTTTTTTATDGSTDVKIVIPSDKKGEAPTTIDQQISGKDDTPTTTNDKTPLQKEESQNGGMGHGDYGFIPSN